MPGSLRRCVLLPVRISLFAVFALAPGFAQSAPLRELHFSPDGRYVLALDDADITVLTAHPPAVLLRIPVHDVREPQFTPDSQQIIFISSVSHVERWSIADHTRVSAQGVPIRECGTERISPDGRYLACVDPEGTLRLVNVATGGTVLERRKYGVPSIELDGDGGYERVLMDPSRARTDFSPDGRFFVASPALFNSDFTALAIARDLRTGSAIGLRKGLTLLEWGISVGYFLPQRVEYFTFVTTNSFMISDLFWAKDSVVTARLMEFPSGKEISRPKLPIGPLHRAADPSYVIVRPFGSMPTPHYDHGHGENVYRPPDSQTTTANRRAAAVEISTGQVIISETPALDVFHNMYVAEPNPGEVGLYERGKGLQATIALHQK